MSPDKDCDAVEPYGGEYGDNDQCVFYQLNGEEAFAVAKTQEVVAVEGDQYHKDSSDGKKLEQHDGGVPFIAEKGVEEGCAQCGYPQHYGEKDEGREAVDAQNVSVK